MRSVGVVAMAISALNFQSTARRVAAVGLIAPSVKEHEPGVPLFEQPARDLLKLLGLGPHWFAFRARTCRVGRVERHSDSSQFVSVMRSVRISVQKAAASSLLHEPAASAVPQPEARFLAFASGTSNARSEV